jgi:hypothetical protein
MDRLLRATLGPLGEDPSRSDATLPHGVHGAVARDDDHGELEDRYPVVVEQIVVGSEAVLACTLEHPQVCERRHPVIGVDERGDVLRCMTQSALHVVRCFRVERVVRIARVMQ